MFGFATLFIALVAFAPAQKSKPWPVPDKYEKMKNPVKADELSLKDGKALYKKHCESCHGKAGKGDGSKSAQLETDPGNFPKDLPGQTDGALYYKVAEGRDDMPSFKKKIPEAEEIWHIVNYMRTFK
ncbi:MAG: cytochrome c [Hymenobacteraceae bacterium]|nr:cytochrome c [Hymenobacteraceae bacterium]MDX5394578.1 cytochrome c [Hymenobacteraceae bacterium]MDX5443597.1 cytochrome c [Hymenobacteraceae bacterium]MDX5510604.1 cytochrome c [Hymenobacteraceae bacterium]